MAGLPNGTLNIPVLTAIPENSARTFPKLGRSKAMNYKFTTILTMH
jgi:hypothetical protein